MMMMRLLSAMGIMSLAFGQMEMLLRAASTHPSICEWRAENFSVFVADESLC